MCYKCGFCQNVVPAGLSRRVYTEYRQRPSRKFKTKFSIDANGEIHSYAEEVPSVDREIRREIPVCLGCHLKLTVEEMTPTELLNWLERERRKQQRAVRVITLTSRRTRLAPPLPCGEVGVGTA